MRCVAALVLTLAFAPAASAGPITFELLPASGAISGDAGSTIGWGYSVTNDSESRLELTGIGADWFEHALADASPFDYAILAPGVTHSVAFDAVAPLGLYRLTWDALAPAASPTRDSSSCRRRFGTAIRSRLARSSPRRQRCPPGIPHR